MQPNSRRCCKGEILALRSDHFDLTEQVVTIRAQLQERADGTFWVGPPKTAAGFRHVSLSAFLIEEIEAHIKDYVDDVSSDLLFRGSRGGPLRNAVLHSAWSRARESVRLAYLHFHDLRHSGNTLAASTGASTRELMVRMGHASAEAALKYQHASRERDRTIAAKLDVLVAKTRRLSDEPPPSGHPPAASADNKSLNEPIERHVA
jgi:integrase